ERMDSEVMTNQWSREELQRAHDNFAETANRCAEAGEWRDWANLFTEDAHYVEHMFGEMYGREEIHRCSPEVGGSTRRALHGRGPGRGVRRAQRRGRRAAGPS